MKNDSTRSGSEAENALHNGRAVSTPSFDTLFDLLADSRRRYALYALTGTEDGLADVETLADEVALWEARTGDAKLSETRRQEVADELREEHLPRLADADIAEYDERSDAVRYWRQPTLEEYLEHTHFKEAPDD
jgi:Arc/MetJ-type ribon-helix-helix transcriptional regulator